MRRILSAAVVSVSVLGSTIISSGVASAHPPYRCDPNMVCLYYNSIEHGLNGIFIQSTHIPNYQNYTFDHSTSGSEGYGQTVKNNAGAVYNRLPIDFAVFYNGNYSCAVACQKFPPFTLRNLNSVMKNNNASGLW
ncbi:peptidase inhibitor family I36 protein [Streptomyces zhihengii]|uniref:peptidase inhibitor family I36 protein n=1 Tax=Streptomyces zhihengii TaxID=1818004 RepID=UPI0033A380C6